MRPRPVQSRYLGRRWSLPQVGAVTLRLAPPSVGRAVDRMWRHQHPERDVANAWQWERILQRAAEAFCLVDASGQAQSLWATSRSLIQIHGQAWYRLDFLEVAPHLRGRHAGLFSLGLASARAIERQALGLVLGSLPEMEGFYRRAGGMLWQGAGWNVESGLIPFRFDRAAVARLKELVDGLEIEED